MNWIFEYDKLWKTLQVQVITMLYIPQDKKEYGVIKYSNIVQTYIHTFINRHSTDESILYTCKTWSWVHQRFGFESDGKTLLCCDIFHTQLQNKRSEIAIKPLQSKQRQYWSTLFMPHALWLMGPVNEHAILGTLSHACAPPMMSSSFFCFSLTFEYNWYGQRAGFKSSELALVGEFGYDQVNGMTSNKYYTVK